MAEAKTKPTNQSVAAHIAAIDDETRRADCHALIALMRKVTKHEPVMWGPSIVGFDTYHYRYASGREGDACLVGFAPRKGDISIYLLCGFESAEMQVLLAQLGPHKAAKACLYVKRLADIQLPVLERLVVLAARETRRRYPQRAAGDA